MTSMNNEESYNLADLEQQLQDLSHNVEALDLIRQFADKLGKTKNRQLVFGAEGALVRFPIEYEDVLQRNLVDEKEDSFSLLQGDIISTDAAYFLGERISGSKFAVVNSTCDLVPKRRKYSSLLRLQPISTDDPNVKQLLGELLKFSSTKKMYLPPLPNDADNVVANAIIFDGMIQIQLEDLLVSTRHASLSLIGWRIFGSLLRSILVRTGDREVAIRQAISGSINQLTD
jgi:hypothetical protein